MDKRIDRSVWSRRALVIAAIAGWAGVAACGKAAEAKQTDKDKRASPPGAPADGGRLSRPEIFHTALEVCVLAFAPDHPSSAVAEAMSKIQTQMKEQIRRLGVHLPAMPVATGDFGKDIRAKLEYMNLASGAFLDAMHDYPDRDTALVMLSGNLCIIQNAYAPGSPLAHKAAEYLARDLPHAGIDAAVGNYVIEKVAADKPRPEVQSAAYEVAKGVEGYLEQP
jgi:hypothetical protein